MTDPFTVAHAHRATTLTRRSLVLKTVAAGLAATALAAIAARNADAAASVTESLDAVLAAGIAGGLPGIALQVDHAGASIYSGAVGYASLEEQTPLEASDRFRIYSITKTFTATIVLQLVDEGILSLDDTVTQWLDDPAVDRIPHVEQITLRQLLTRTSGVYDYQDETDSSFYEDAFLGPGADWAKVWTPEELLAYADGANHSPAFAPGQGLAYSNTGYVLLGMVIEAATARTFGDELHDRILLPLGLHDTTLETGASLSDDVVDGYQQIEAEMVNVSAINLTWSWTGGGLVSTTADLARFSRAVFSGELLSPASVEEMFTFVPGNWHGVEFGMGVIRVPTPNGAMVGMDGGGAGGNSVMMRLPAADLTVVVLVNLAPDEGAINAIRDEAIAAVLATT